MLATTRSHDSTISVPPARAGPSTAAMMGLVRLRLAMPPNPPLAVASSPARPSLMALRSAPAREHVALVGQHAEPDVGIRPRPGRCRPPCPRATSPLTAFFFSGRLMLEDTDVPLGFVVDHGRTLAPHRSGPDCRRDGPVPGVRSRRHAARLGRGPGRRRSWPSGSSARPSPSATSSSASASGSASPSTTTWTPTTTTRPSPSPGSTPWSASSTVWAVCSNKHARRRSGRAGPPGLGARGGAVQRRLRRTQAARSGAGRPRARAAEIVFVGDTAHDRACAAGGRRPLRPGRLEPAGRGRSRAIWCWPTRSDLLDVLGD